METQKKLFLNPVLAPPWKAQKKNYENPNVFIDTLEGCKKRRTENYSISKIRQQNLDSLIMRFPGLKKYQARAALTMSSNKLDKAIILLEVANCYRKEVVEKKLHLAYLKNIHINLFYDCEEQDPSVRNIVFRSSLMSENDSSSKSSSCNDSDREGCEGKGKKVGVVITKTNTGYKATPFLENRK